MKKFTITVISLFMVLLISLSAVGGRRGYGHKLKICVQSGLHTK